MKLYIRKTLLMCGTAAWAAVSATAAMAQERQVEAPEHVAAPEEIIVTGTRLRSPNLDSPSPITSMSEEMMAYTGKTEIRQIVAEIGALVGASGTNQLGTGESALNLRNLGESRTLTLVDGRRFVSAFGGNSAVDTNVLPLALIERVDVLTGGASAVYGADAVTGVVNFIQKKDYEGLGFDAQYGDAQRGNFRDQTYAITAGHNFDGGRGNVTVNFTYGNRPLVRASARDLSQIVVERINNPDGPKPRYVLAVGSREGFFSDGGALIDPIGLFSAGYKGDGTPFAHGRNLVGWSGFSELGGDGPLSYRLFTNDIQPSNDRKILTVRGHYDVGDAFKPYVDLHLSDVRNRSLSQPTVSIIQPIAADTAYIPASVRAAAAGAPITYNRWDFDVGNTDTRVDKRTVRIVLGAQGALSDHLQYDISANYGKVRRRQHTANTRFYDRYLAAIDAVVDPASGRVVCRSDIDPSSFNRLGGDVINAFDASQGAVTFTPGRNSGCVPFNPFTTDVASQAQARAWIYQPTVDYVHNAQTVVSGYLNYDTGAFFNLPGGPVSLVGGAEYRKEKSEATYGPFTGSPRAVTSIQGVDIVGQYDVTELFGEASLPLLKDKGPFIRELTIDGAFRYSDYSTVGKTETWKVGGVFATAFGLKLRGTISQAARAPTIAELYTPQARSIASLGTNDPCSPQSINLGTPSRKTNCEATLLALGINPATFNPTQATIIQTLDGGNPNLKEERSRTKTVGIVWQPDFVPGLSLSADYYNIELSDAVITPGTTAIFNACYDAPDLNNQFCALLQRDPATGFASFVELTSVNVAKIYTSGYDFAGSYRRETGIGRFTLSGNASYLKRLKLQKTVAPALTDERGLYSTSTRGSSPKWTVNLDLTWSRGPWDANYGFNYSSRTLREGFTNDQASIIDTLVAEPKMKAFVNHDIQVGYQLNGIGRLYAGIRNLTNEYPDKIQGSLNGYFGRQGLAGRTFYIGARIGLADIWN